MRFSVLASSSKANCTFVEVQGLRILIDCGLSCRETERRLVSLGIDPGTIAAILITHEHHDHTRGLTLFSKKHKLPVYANKETMLQLPKSYARERFVSGEEFLLEGVSISPFSTVHDAVDPVGFLIEGDGVKFGIATDLGKVTELVRTVLRGCHSLVLESNHDRELLYTCDYPWDLKQRILSSHGHLSNDDAGSLLAELMHAELFHVVLAHLSENSNTPTHAMETVGGLVDTSNLTSFLCASAYSPTPCFEVSSNAACRYSMNVNGIPR